MDWLLAIAKEHGLFVALVVYVIWDGREREKASRLENRKREQQYLAIIDKLSKSFESLKRDVSDMKDRLIEWGGKGE